jgi:anti-anti-sigma factor
MSELAPTGNAIGGRSPVVFRIDEEKGTAAGVVLAPHGELDLRVAPELRDRISTVIEDGADTVVIDLSAVTFIDSMALGVLVGAARRLEPRGGRLRLVVPAPELRAHASRPTPRSRLHAGRSFGPAAQPLMRLQRLCDG